MSAQLRSRRPGLSARTNRQWRSLSGFRLPLPPQSDLAIRRAGASFQWHSAADPRLNADQQTLVARWAAAE
jgi:hypothetical protein